MNQNLLKWICAGVVAATSATAGATSSFTMINTFANFDGNVFGLSNGEQIGNTINLNALNYSLTGFEFEYAVPGNSLAANVGVNLTFYNVDAFGRPTTVFYNSGFFYNTPVGSIPASASGNDLGYGSNYGYDDFALGEGGSDSITIPDGYLMPTQFIFTVEFTNIAPNQITVPIAATTNNYPNTTPADYWVNNNGVWNEYTNAVGNNLLFSFTGVPEPTTFALTGLGGLVLLGVAQLKRKR